MVFPDRLKAGQTLVQTLSKFSVKNPLVLALPRGGVPVGFEIARGLKVPLDIVVVRKIGSPENPEYGIGAVAEGGVVVWDLPVIAKLGVDPNILLEERRVQEAEIVRRVKEYRGGRLLPDLSRYAVILVDDGLATGVTAKAAIQAVKKLNPQRIIFASPVCPQDTSRDLKSLVDQIICLIRPEKVISIGSWYKNFDQVTDQEVIDLLKESKRFSPNLPISNFQLGF